MAISTTQQTSIMKAASALFNKAFSPEMVTGFETFYASNANSLSDLADGLIGSSVYEAQYNGATTIADYATVLMAHYGLSYAGTTAADTNMKAFVEYSFANKASWASNLQTIQAVDKFLTTTLIPSIDSTDAIWGTMAQAIDNKATVATNFKNSSTNAGSELSLEMITSDASTVSGSTGVVSDGYISGATLFADANGDGIWNSGEAKATTNASGGFTIIGGKGSVVAQGGKDISTGLAFEGKFTAPTGATTVSALTTLVEQVMKSDTAVTASQAAAKVAQALGISSDVNLLTFDPIKAATDTTSSATLKSVAMATQAAAVQVTNMFNQSASMLSGAGVSTEAHGSTAAAASLASMILTASAASTTVDITSAATMKTFLETSATKAGASTEQVAKVAAVSSSVATATANINSTMADSLANAAAGTSAADVFKEFAKTQVAAGDIAALTKTAAETGSITAVTAAADKAAITTAAAAKADVVTAAQTAANDAIVAEGGTPPAAPTAPVTPPASGGGGGGSPADTTAPSMSSAAVATNGQSIVITYSEKVAGTLEASDWGVTLSAGTTTVTGATIGSGADADKVTLTLSNTLIGSLTVTNLVYTATNSTANSVKDQATTPNNAATQTLGTVTNGSTITAVSGTASAMETASASWAGTEIVTISDAPTVAQLKAINAATTGAITLTTANGGLSGTAADLVLAFAGTITTHTGTVQITDSAYTVADLKAINDATSGAITLTDATVALSGTVSDVKAALAGTITTHTGTVAITDVGSVAAADLNTINTKTSGVITAAGATIITGDLAGVGATYSAGAGEIAGLGDEAITLSDTTLDDTAVAGLATLNTGTTGLITAASVTAMAGTTAHVKAVTDAIAGSGDKISIGTMTSDVSNVAVTISDANDAAIAATDLSAIGAKTSGVVTVTNAIAISGTTAAVTAALVTTDTLVVAATAKVTISDNAYTVASLKAINDATSGAITLTDATVALSGTVSDVKAALAGTITTHTGTVAITDVGSVAAADLNTINTKTSGVITAAGATIITGDLAGVGATYSAGAGEIAGLGDEAITLSDTTLDDTAVAGLATLNTGTTGLITAASVTAMAGTTAHVKAVTDAIAGSGDKISIGTMTSDVSNVAVTISDANDAAIAATDLSAIGAKTSGVVTVTNAIAISGTTAAVTAALVTTDTLVVAATAKVTISDNAYTVASLKAINDATSGAITLTDATVALSGTVSDVKAALAGTITTHTGTVAITDVGSVAAADLNTINTKTSGVITAAGATIITGDLAGVGATYSAGAGEIAGLGDEAITLSDTTLDDTAVAGLATLNTGTTGLITAASVTAMAGTTAHVKAVTDAIAGSGDKISIGTMTSDVSNVAVTISDANDAAIAATDLSAIGAKTSGVVTVTNAIAISGTTAAVTAALVTTDSLVVAATAKVTITGADATIAQYADIDDVTTGAITVTMAATAGTDVFLLHNNILTIGDTTAFTNGTDKLSFLGAVASGTLQAATAITNDAGNTLTATTLNATNSNIYVIDTDATDLTTASATHTIGSFTDMANVAAFLSDGFVTANSTGKIDYFVINDGSDATKAYVYKFVDDGSDAVLDVDGSELTLIGTVTTDSSATTTVDIVIA